MPPRRVHYVLSTHWDREWYQTFQDYRYRLVRLLDRIIAGWERDELRGPFQCDGQAIILEDYLEVRPERRSQVERFRQRRQVRHRPLVRAARRVPRLRRVAGAQPRARPQARAPVRRAAVERRLHVRHVRPQQPDAADLRRLRHHRRLHLAGSKHHRSAHDALARGRRHRAAVLSLRPQRLLQLRQRGALCARSAARTRPGAAARAAGGLSRHRGDGDADRADAGVRRRRSHGMGSRGLRRDRRAAGPASRRLRGRPHLAGCLSGRDGAAGAGDHGGGGRRAPRAGLLSRSHRPSVVDPWRRLQPGLDQAGQRRVPSCALPMGRAVQRARASCRPCGVPAGLSRRGLEVAIDEPSARFDLRLLHRCRPRGHEVPLRPGRADRQPADD